MKIGIVKDRAMHDPRNKWFKMPNKLCEALINAGLPVYARKVVDFIIRQSLGYRREQTRPLKLSDFARDLKMEKHNVFRELRQLEEANIVIHTDYGRERSYRISRDFGQWKTASREKASSTRTTERNPDGLRSVIHTDYGLDEKPLGENDPPNPKDNLKDNSKDIHIDFVNMDADGENPHRLVHFLLQEIRKNKPDFKSNFDERMEKVWTKEMDLLIRKGEKEPKRIAEVIRWCQEDNVPNQNGFCLAYAVLSPGNLRKHFDRIELALDNESEDDRALKEYYRSGRAREKKGQENMANEGKHFLEETTTHPGSGVMTPVDAEELDWENPDLESPDTISKGVKKIVEECGESESQGETKQSFEGMGDDREPRLIGKDAVRFEEKRKRLKELHPPVKY